MVDTLNREFIGSRLVRLKKHDTGHALDILPFLANKNKPISGNFNNLLGEYIRNILGIKEKNFKKKDQEFYMSEENEMSESIASEVDFENDDDRYDFIRFLNQYLFNQNEIKPIHPYLFNYIKLDEKKQNEFKKYSRFMNEVLVRDRQEIKEIFSNKETEDILTELILDKLDNIQGMTDKKAEHPNKPIQYEALLPTLSKLYQDDMVYLSQYKDYFLTSFPILTNFYAFIYVCQLVYKFEQYTEADYTRTQPLFFALEWESINKRRKATDHLDGYKFIRNHAHELFPHIHTMSQLSHNTVNDQVGDGEKVHYLTYSKLYELVKNQGEEYEESFLTELKQWIIEYSEWAHVDNITDESTNLPEAFRVLFKCLKEGTNSEVAKKYGENIDDLGAPFIKSRGSLGKVLNIKHDFLLLLTAVSVKDKRMPLNELFTEFEKRGVAFDRYSKKEIITLFDNHNILDKKSDSGDAQYVKPILF